MRKAVIFTSILFLFLALALCLRLRLPTLQAIDIGSALSVMAEDDSTASQTYELHGPRPYTMAEIASLVDREIVKHRRHINIPPFLLKRIARLLNKYIWWPTMSEDEVEREFLDQVIDPNAKGFKDLGIEPGDIGNFTFQYLQDYRSSSFYDLPPSTEREKREEKKYLHVLDDQ